VKNCDDSNSDVGQVKQHGPRLGEHEGAGYEVGYRRPPKEHQFRKGQSGNQKGRPKGRRSFLSLLNDALNEQVTVNEGGQRRKIKKRVAAAKQIANKAASGDYRTIKMLIELDQSSELDENVNREAVLAQVRQRVAARLQKYAEIAKAEEEVSKLGGMGPLDSGMMLDLGRNEP
jgi:hypothetical protein